MISIVYMEYLQLSVRIWQETSLCSITPVLRIAAK